jgi:hypothetical protein
MTNTKRFLSSKTTLRDIHTNGSYKDKYEPKRKYKGKAIITKYTKERERGREKRREEKERTKKKGRKKRE